jgi:hypothetical protein
MRSCPWCHVTFYTDVPAFNNKHKEPAEKDVMICERCHGVGVLHDGVWCVPTDDEHDDLMQDKRFLKALATSIARAVEAQKEKPPN